MKYILGIQTAEFPNEICLVKTDKKRIDNSTSNVFHFKQREQTIECLKDSVEKLLKKEGIEVCNISLVSVCLGPGSYTGTRGGVAFAKGLGQFSKVPIIGVSAFEVLKENVKSDKNAMNVINVKNVENVIYILDARNERVYYKNDVKDSDPIEVGNISNVISKLKDKTLFIGSGAVACKDIITQKLKEKAEFAKEDLNKLSAINVAKVGLKKYLKDPSIFTKEYLLKVKPLYILAPNVTEKKLSS
jgi:tRNA threonylcarbamoyl adenosine modification protein YeaZ